MEELATTPRRELTRLDFIYGLRPIGVSAAGGQADEVACQAEADDLPPSVGKQPEQPKRPCGHVVNVQKGIAFLEQRLHRREGSSQNHRLEKREIILLKRRP